MIGYLIRYVLEPRNLKDYEEVIVITDSVPVSRKREAIEKAVKQTLSRMLPNGTRYKILHHASKSCTGLQIADYCNWAIFRKWERGDLRSYELIRSGIRSEFDIFKSGPRHYY
jgi:GTP-dependent phosphoenolpyruvate carboxykinase